jgi:cold shock CspA family protein
MTPRDGNVIQETERRLCGVVKWFDPSKGLGFIVADATQDDILLHANVLRKFGQSSVADNARIEFNDQGSTKGVQATVVLSLHHLKQNQRHRPILKMSMKKKWRNCHLRRRA